MATFPHPETPFARGPWGSWLRSLRRSRPIDFQIPECPWFDVERYLQQVPGLSADQAWSHFAGPGWRIGLSPHPWFDVDHYLSQSPNLEGLDPISHFRQRGWRYGLTPHPLFDVIGYLDRIGDPGEWTDPLHHYLMVGAAQGISPSPLIDLEYIRSRHRSLRSSGADPCTTLWDAGFDERFRPHPLFHLRTLRRLQRSEEGADAEPWDSRHVLRRWASRDWIGSPSVLFDLEFYSRKYPETQSHHGGCWGHFIDIGQFEDRDPNAYFDSAWYRRRYGHQLGHRSPFQHYLLNEPSLRFDPSERFDVSHYAARHRHDLSEGTGALEHFLEFGRYRGAEIRPNLLPAHLKRHVNAARTLDPSLDVTERDLARLPQINRHRSVRVIKVYRDFINRLGSGFQVLVLVSGATTPTVRAVELVKGLIGRRELHETYLLATDGPIDPWLPHLPVGARAGAWDANTLEPLDERMRISLTQFLIEDDRPDFTVFADSINGWQLLANRGKGISALTRCFSLVDTPNAAAALAQRAPCRAATRFLTGAVISSIDADEETTLMAYAEELGEQGSANFQLVRVAMPDADGSGSYPTVSSSSLNSGSNSSAAASSGVPRGGFE